MDLNVRPAERSILETRPLDIVRCATAIHTARKTATLPMEHANAGRMWKDCVATAVRQITGVSTRAKDAQTAFAV